MDLFEYARELQQEKEAPLASRLRPTTLEEVVGQQHIIGKGKLLYRAIKADKLNSVIFYGPPGYREDNSGQGHCERYKCTVLPDQCYCGGEKRYGSSRGGGKKDTGDVPQEDDPVHR